jgi:hypothetical protein
MLNLILSILVICSTFGYTIAKTSTPVGTKRQRQHTSPLSLDKDLFK